MGNVIGQFSNIFNGKKIPCRQRLLHEDKFVTAFQVKSEIFNCHFAKQCSHLKKSNPPSDLATY